MRYQTSSIRWKPSPRSSSMRRVEPSRLRDFPWSLAVACGACVAGVISIVYTVVLPLTESLISIAGA